MLSSLFPPMRDHMESISTSSALSGFTYMAIMATELGNVRMKTRAQSADTLAEVTCNASVYLEIRLHKLLRDCNFRVTAQQQLS